MTALHIPKKIRVGQKWYSVEVVEAMAEKYIAGEVEFHNRKIKIGKTTARGRPLPPAELKETFWHELVHAILEDMGEHRLNNRESFVEGFAYRLSKAIETARF